MGPPLRRASRPIIWLSQTTRLQCAKQMDRFCPFRPSHSPRLKGDSGNAIPFQRIPPRTSFPPLLLAVRAANGLFHLWIVWFCQRTFPLGNIWFHGGGIAKQRLRFGQIVAT